MNAPTQHVLHGNNLELLARMPDCSVHAVVTDPPYGLSFMLSKKHDKNMWDAALPDPRTWSECLRVLRPGGHLVAFGAPRLVHRLTCQIEDAGFEIRDQLLWLFGSGFPKSLDVSKAIDKQDAVEEQEARRLRFTAWLRSTGVTSKQIDDATGTNMGGHYTTAASQPAIMTREHLDACRHLFGQVPEWVEQEANIRTVESQNLNSREVIGTITKGSSPLPGNHKGTWVDGQVDGTFNITAPATDAARQWTGWGTALKPAYEPIVLARKPLDGTVAQTVQRWGTGAINVDACRVEHASENDRDKAHASAVSLANASAPRGTYAPHASYAPVLPPGRWPANLILDEAAGAMLDAQSGERPGAVSNGSRGGGLGGSSTFAIHDRPQKPGRGDSGGASRFFKSAGFDTEEWIIHRAKAMLHGWNPDLASTADDSSTLPRAFVDSALNDVAIWAALGVTLSVEWTGHTTNVTPSESRRIVETAITTTMSIAQGCSLDWLLGRRFQNSSHVSHAERCAQTGTMRITVSRWKSNGSVDPVTLSITPRNSGLGVAGYVDRAFYCPKASRSEREAGLDHLPPRVVDPSREEDAAARDNPRTGAGRSGEARRNHHATVKPIELMRWLVRLVTPPGGIVLEPFAGSGTTPAACALEGVDCIAMEIDAEYVEIARARVAHWRTMR